MKNPYDILGLHQNATKKEIINAKIAAMKKRNYSLQEIQLAEKQLLDPSKRLVADFMFPSRIKAKRPKPIKIELKKGTTNLEDIDLNAFNSL